MINFSDSNNPCKASWSYYWGVCKGEVGYWGRNSSTKWDKPRQTQAITFLWHSQYCLWSGMGNDPGEFKGSELVGSC
jgi:hypothetical protein